MKAAFFVLGWTVLGCGSEPGAAPDAAPIEADGSADAAPGDKTCSGQPVELDDPATGCAGASCQACPVPAGASAAICSASGACDYTCPPGLHQTATGCGPAALGIAATNVVFNSDYTCAIAHDRSVRCWGELVGTGLVQLASSLTPQPMAGLADVQQLAAGGFHVCALTGAGDVSCWGRNDNGQLGDGTADSATPIAVPGLPAAAKAIAAGFDHTCAALVTGDVWCWGANSNQRLGRTTATTTGNPPGPITFTAPDVVQLAASRWHTCGLRANGHVLCWGANLSGELGIGAFTAPSLPVEVSGISNAIAVAAGGDASSVVADGVTASGGSTWVVRADGSVVAFGLKNPRLGLGQGSTRIHTPTAISQLSGVTAIAIGAEHACALATAGKAFCWGSGAFGKIGTPGFEAANKLLFVPTQIADFGSGISALAAGRNHTCMVKDAELRCAGNNGQGQLGDGTSGNFSVTGVTVSWQP